MEMGQLPDISVSSSCVPVHAVAPFVFQAMSSSWQNPMSQVYHNRYAREGFFFWRKETTGVSVYKQ